MIKDHILTENNGYIIIKTRVITKHYLFMDIGGCHVTFSLIFDMVNLSFVDLVQSEVGPPHVPRPMRELRAIVVVHGH